MRRLARDAGLPPPRVNAIVLGHEQDIAWPQLRLVIEVDGHHYHAPRGARETDHERDAELVLAGWRVLRFTKQRSEREPVAVAVAVAAQLGTASARF